MTGPLDRAAAFLLAPTARAAAAAPAAAVPASARVVVLGADDAARPLGAALALRLRAADRAAVALVAVWRAAGAGAPPVRGAATRSAARLANRLGMRAPSAVARGKLAWLDLPLDPADAITAVHQAAAVVEGPLVTVLAGPRPRELDTLVEQHDIAILAADPDRPLARAALAGMADACISAVACRPLARGVPRALAVAGLAAPRLDPPLTAAPAEAP